MNIKKNLALIFFKTVRIIGLLLLIYACMVFYLILTERQHAYPRAISHTEAVAFIDTLAKPVTCILPDELILNGWTMGSDKKRVLLYFPDTEEDASQFLAETYPLEEMIVTFNYRGSAGNKGKPSEKTFEKDAESILECALQIHPHPILIGRGTGAILASQLTKANDTLILIDPTPSIKASIADKYRLLLPSFLIRNKTEMKSLSSLDSSLIIILQDRKNKITLSEKVSKQFPEIRRVSRDGKTLKQALQFILNL
ncbi:MAG: alpha/beta hydrolase [Fibrobacter sp.]|jgi:hypothetical protein|nr:alpha/beta hydrolase [Fibrobacter sp.]HQB64510.1 alpha/beta hydrolase [Fibrobacteraceae bacterium]